MTAHLLLDKAEYDFQMENVSYCERGRSDDLISQVTNGILKLKRKGKCLEIFTSSDDNNDDE